LGYGDIALTRSPGQKARRSALALVLYSGALMGLAVLADRVPLWAWPAALFSPLAHEGVIAWGRGSEERGAPRYVAGDRPEVLDVLPGSPADRLGLRPGDRIVVTSLDHDANVTPWRLAAADRGVAVDMARFDSDTYRLEVESVERVLTDRTRLVAVTHASNALGTIPDVAGIVEVAHAAGALVYVDAVHYAPHGPIDVRAIGADFLVASAYKFHGPHTGALYGRAELLEELEAYKVRPAPDTGAEKWETGTQSFESLAGVAAAVDYLASLGEGEDRRARILDAHAAIERHVNALSRRFLDGLGDHITLHGIPGVEGRTPTFAITCAGRTPAEVAAHLASRGLYVWEGHYYAIEPMAQLGLLDQGGAVRIGFVHTTTGEEVDRLLGALDELA